MIAILEEREMRRVFCLVELFVQRLLVGGGIDRVTAAMAIGKAKDGTDVLILGSDNNFSTGQKSQFYAFKINHRPQ